MRLANCLAVVSVLAMMAPDTARAEDIGRVSYKGPVVPQERPQSVQLATPTPASNGTEYIPVGRDSGPFEQLRLDANRGHVYVIGVAVRFGDGHLGNFRVDRWLDPAHPSVTVNLPRAPWIDTIIVTTDRDGRGSYVVFGLGAHPSEPSHGG